MIESSPFTTEQTSLAAFAGALAHPARIAIITHLQKHEQSTCGEIVATLPLAQATVSQHLKVLLDEGLLLLEKDGPKSLYRIDCDKVLAFCHSFQCCLNTQPPSSS